MAAWLPLPSGFTGYATRFAHPALGFALGWNYWFKVRGDPQPYPLKTRSNRCLVHHCYAQQSYSCLSSDPVLASSR